MLKIRRSTILVIISLSLILFLFSSCSSLSKLCCWGKKHNSNKCVDINPILSNWKLSSLMIHSSSDISKKWDSTVSNYYMTNDDGIGLGMGNDNNDDGSNQFGGYFDVVLYPNTGSITNDIYSDHLLIKSIVYKRFIRVYMYNLTNHSININCGIGKEFSFIDPSVVYNFENERISTVSFFHNIIDIDNDSQFLVNSIYIVPLDIIVSAFKSNQTLYKMFEYEIDCCIGLSGNVSESESKYCEDKLRIAYEQLFSNNSCWCYNSEVNNSKGSSFVISVGRGVIVDIYYCSDDFLSYFYSNKKIENMVNVNSYSILNLIDDYYMNPLVGSILVNFNYSICNTIDGGFRDYSYTLTYDRL